MLGAQLWGLEQSNGKNIRALHQMWKRRDTFERELGGLLESEIQSANGLASAAQTQPKKTKAQGPLYLLVVVVVSNIDGRNNLVFDS